MIQDVVHLFFKAKLCCESMQDKPRAEADLNAWSLLGGSYTVTATWILEGE